MRSAPTPSGAFMACNLPLSYRISNSFAFLCKSNLSFSSNKTPRLSSNVNPTRFRCRSVMTSSFSWDDVSRISQSDDALDDPSDLQPYFEKIRSCNRGSEMQSEFLPFVIEEQIAGYIHHRYADLLKKFQDVFIFPQDKSYDSHFGGYVTLHPSLGSPEDRTGAVEDVIKCLGEEFIPAIPCDIITWGTSIFLA